MSTPQDKRTRLVLFGEQRSGTTLLSGLLNAQPGVQVTNGYLSAMMYCGYRELGLSAHDELSARQRNVLWQRIRASERQRDLKLESSMPPQVRTFDHLHAHLLERNSRPDHRIIGHKIHGPIEALPALLELPDVRCIYLIRDARDVLLSRSYRGESALDEPAKGWLESAAVARAHADHKRLFPVRFEELISTPAAVLARLGEWLGIEVVAASGPVGADGRPELQNSSHGDLNAAFDAQAVSRFRTHRTSRLVRFAQWRCASELRAWGYPLDAELQPSLAERLEFARRVLVVRSLELPRRAKNALLSRALPSLVRDD